MQKIPYASAVGSLMYAQIGSIRADWVFDSTFWMPRQKIHIAIFICWWWSNFMEVAKQTLVTSSTMEAEFVACYEASNQGIWLRNFVTRLLTIDVTKATLILCQYS
ncbi:hypothetical protein AAG906_003844 [Vitis piasezkii]